MPVSGVQPIHPGYALARALERFPLCTLICLLAGALAGDIFFARTSFHPLVTYFGRAICWSAAVSGISTYIGLCYAQSMMSGQRRQPRFRIGTAVRPWVWLLPILVFGNSLFPVALVSVWILPLVITRQLLSAQEFVATDRASGRKTSAEPNGREHRWTRFLLALASAGLLHAALIATTAGAEFPAALLADIAGVLLLVVCSVYGEYRPRHRTTVRELGFVAAILLMLAVEITGVPVWRQDAIKKPNVVMLERPDEKPAQQEYRTVLGGESYPGVILEGAGRTIRSEKKTRLYYAPGQRSPNSSQPLEFSGEYWVFQAASDRPPPNSLLENKGPLVQTYRSVDGAPLQMEGHFYLPEAVPTALCSEVTLSTATRDSYPGTVALELLVNDSVDKGLPNYRSLGRRTVWSSATEETERLSFPCSGLPAGAHLRELVVRYHLAEMRADRSARVQISSFAVVPTR